METRSAKRKRLLSAAAAATTAVINIEQTKQEDLISDLPDDILHHVFSFLPIKSIARTGVLSKRWRSLWLTFPDLDFTTVGGSFLTNAALLTPSNARKKLRPSAVKSGEFMDHILNLRGKHSDIRVLRIRALLSCSRLGRLIRHAVKHNVRELDMEVSITDHFNFPRSIVCCRSLRVLRLKSWHDQPSLVNLFTGSAFPLLRDLHLESCLGLQKLRIDCHGLQSLRLESCKELQNLEIIAMKLEKLTVSSCFDVSCSGSWVKIEAPALKMMDWSNNAATEECRLENLTSMEEASLGFIPNQDLCAAKIRSLYQMIAAISKCSKLTLGNHWMKILSKTSKSSPLILCHFNRLMSLAFSTGFNKDDCPGMARVFQSSPIIHTIVINISAGGRKWYKNPLQNLSSGSDLYWESRTESLKSFLQHLKVVKIHGFTECTHHVSLVTFLLKHANALEELLLCTMFSKQTRCNLRLGKIKAEIMGFSRASPNASIIFK